MTADFSSKTTEARARISALQLLKEKAPSVKWKCTWQNSHCQLQSLSAVKRALKSEEMKDTREDLWGLVSGIWILTDWPRLRVPGLLTQGLGCGAWALLWASSCWGWDDFQMPRALEDQMKWVRVRDLQHHWVLLLATGEGGRKGSIRAHTCYNTHVEALACPSHLV